MKLRAVGLTESGFTFMSVTKQRPIVVRVDEDGFLTYKNDDGDVVELDDDVAADLLRDTSFGPFIIAENDDDLAELKEHQGEIADNDPNRDFKPEESDEAHLYDRDTPDPRVSDEDVDVDGLRSAEADEFDGESRSIEDVLPNGDEEE